MGPGCAIKLIMDDRQPARRFSMIRDFQLADFFTLLNGFAGTGAVLSFMGFLVTHQRGRFWLGVGLLPIALVMDVLDGRIARWRREASPLGQELDSLADVVSFGVAPATMGFAVGLQGGWDALCLVYFVGCGISRLARYNATAAQLSDARGKVTHFEGLPIPSSLLVAMILAALAAAGRWGDALPFSVFRLGPAILHPLSVLYVLHGSAMISKTLRIPKP
jgi:CDP-diacylglycerol--serine O-phosphatidyltransferase